jgi:hypothetical protein
MLIRTRRHGPPLQGTDDLELVSPTGDPNEPTRHITPTALGLQRYDSDVGIALHQRAWSDQQHRLGLDHTDTLAARASSPTACREAGRSEEAIALHQQTLTPSPPAGGQVCTLVAVDITGFTRRDRDDDIRRYLHEELYRVLQKAFDSSGIPWAACCHEDRGDGVLIIVPPGIACKGIIDPLPERLRRLIRLHNHVCRPAAGIQLRVAAHIGLVDHDGHGFIGSDIDFLFRMLEARPLKRTLTSSGPELALIVSDYVHGNVVSRYPSLVSPDAFRPARFQVKYTRAKAWIYLPGTPPSGVYPPHQAITSEAVSYHRDGSVREPGVPSASPTASATAFSALAGYPRTAAARPASVSRPAHQFSRDTTAARSRLHVPGALAHSLRIAPAISSPGRTASCRFGPSSGTRRSRRRRHGACSGWRLAARTRTHQPSRPR